MNHRKLIEIGRRELARRGCVIILTEIGAAQAEEQPDVIGWDAHGQSILIECKASRADFLADRKKLFRIHPDMGMGVKRFYLTPPGIIAKEEVPDGWGLMEVQGKKITYPVWYTKNHERNLFAEMRSLMRAVRHSRSKIVTAKEYRFENKSRATISSDETFAPDAGIDLPEDGQTFFHEIEKNPENV